MFTSTSPQVSPPPAYQPASAEIEPASVLLPRSEKFGSSVAAFGVDAVPSVTKLSAPTIAPAASYAAFQRPLPPPEVPASLWMKSPVLSEIDMS
ncbi:MAG TPA: hypothetical protein DCG14_10020 [Phycisphaerales bacterium]|nr:hypothetical protein [Phycisphaerales bacterium]